MGETQNVNEGRYAWGVAAIRLITGLVFLAHGSQKLFVFGFGGVAGFMGQLGIPLPAVSAVAITLVEFFGGLALIAGIFTRWASILLAFSMAVAVLGVHLKNGFFLPQGYEYALTLLVVNVGLALTGAGAFSLENALGKSRVAKLAPAGSH